MLMKMNESHFYVWLAPGSKLYHLQHKTEGVTSLFVFTDPGQSVKKTGTGEQRRQSLMLCVVDLARLTVCAHRV